MSKTTKLHKASKGEEVRQTDTRSSIVDAAIRCVERWGLHKVTLNDIAKEAGVSRPTVYSYFSNRDEIIQYALLQSAINFAQRLMVAIDQHESPQQRIIEAFIFTVKSIPVEPYLALVADATMADLVNSSAMTAPEGVRLRREIFRHILQDSSIPEPELDEIIELVARLVLSFLTVKSSIIKTESDMRAFLNRRLLPVLGLNER